MAARARAGAVAQAGAVDVRRPRARQERAVGVAVQDARALDARGACLLSECLRAHRSHMVGRAAPARAGRGRGATRRHVRASFQRRRGGPQGVGEPRAPHRRGRGPGLRGARDKPAGPGERQPWRRAHHRAARVPEGLGALRARRGAAASRRGQVVSPRATRGCPRARLSRRHPRRHRGLPERPRAIRLPLPAARARA